LYHQALSVALARVKKPAEIPRVGISEELVGRGDAGKAVSTERCISRRSLRAAAYSLWTKTGPPGAAGQGQLMAGSRVFPWPPIAAVEKRGSCREGQLTGAAATHAIGKRLPFERRFKCEPHRPSHSASDRSSESIPWRRAGFLSRTQVQGIPDDRISNDSAMSSHCIARPLDPAEAFFFMADRISCMNFVFFAERSGHLDPERIRASLAVIQHENPLLRARISWTADRGLCFELAPTCATSSSTSVSRSRDPP
jgi:hypothetical protein